MTARARARRLPALAVATLLLLARRVRPAGRRLLERPGRRRQRLGGQRAHALGGYTITALAEAVTAQYEQPNFPLPATPSLEFDEGYAATSDNSGPTGTAVASSLYPGQVVANAGPELALLVPGVPLPPAPVWPIEATSEYPQTPNSDQPRRPRREHGHLEHGQRQHGQRHPRRRQPDVGFVVDRPERHRPVRLRQPVSPAPRRSSASAPCRPPRRRRCRASRPRPRPAPPIPASPCSVASSTSAASPPRPPPPRTAPPAS